MQTSKLTFPLTSLTLATGLIALAACGGGSGTTGTGGTGGSMGGATGAGGATASGGAGGATASGGVTGSGGATASTGGTTGTGGATSTGGITGTGGGAGGSASLSIPAGGDHFCYCDYTEAGGWLLGAQKKCRVTYAKVPPLTAEQKKGLDYNCEAPYCTVVTEAECPHAAPDSIGVCTSLDSPVIPTKTYVFVEKAKVTPDTTAFTLDAGGICGSTGNFDLTGKPVSSQCTGTVKAKIDGTLVDFSPHLLCSFKSDGTKSEFFLSVQDATNNKQFNFVIHEEAGAYTVPGTALSPGFGYRDGNQTFAFPKDTATLTVDVTKFLPSGAGLTATFSPGEVWSQPGGKGVGPRVVTEGSIDVAITVN